MNRKSKTYVLGPLASLIKGRRKKKNSGGKRRLPEALHKDKTCASFGSAEKGEERPPFKKKRGVRREVPCAPIAQAGFVTSTGVGFTRGWRIRTKPNPAVVMQGGKQRQQQKK